MCNRPGDEAAGSRLASDLEFFDLLEASCSEAKVLIGRLKPPAGRPWMRPEIQIVIPGECAKGQIAYQAADGRFKRHSMSEGQISIIPPVRPHELLWERGNDLTVLRIAPEFVNCVAPQGDARNLDITGHYGVSDPIIWHLGRELRGELRRHRKLDAPYIQSVARVVARRLVSTYGSARTSLGIGGMPALKLKRAIDYVNENSATGITFREVAAHVKMSAYHFARMFKQSTGVSPHHYIVRCRMERAKKLLTELSLPISDIAFEVGYKSRSQFTTSFRRLTGATPTEYRARG